MERTKLAAVMEQQGRRVNWVTEQLGVSRQIVSRWINGHESLPTERAEQLAEILGVELDEVA